MGCEREARRKGGRKGESAVKIAGDWCPGRAGWGFLLELGLVLCRFISTVPGGEGGESVGAVIQTTHLHELP